MTFPPIGPPQGVPVPVPVGRHDVLDTPEVSPTLITFYTPGGAREYGVESTSSYTYKSLEFRTDNDGTFQPSTAGFKGTGDDWVDLVQTWFRTCKAGSGTNVSITRLTGIVTYKIEWTSTVCRLYQNGSVIATITSNIPTVACMLVMTGANVAFTIDNVSII